MYHKVSIFLNQVEIAHHFHMKHVPQKGDIIESFGGYPALLVASRSVDIHADIWKIHCIRLEEAIQHDDQIKSA